MSVNKQGKVEIIGVRLTLSTLKGVKIIKSVYKLAITIRNSVFCLVSNVKLTSHSTLKPTGSYRTNTCSEEIIEELKKNVTSLEKQIEQKDAKISEFETKLQETLSERKSEVSLSSLALDQQCP